MLEQLGPVVDVKEGEPAFENEAEPARLSHAPPEVALSADIATGTGVNGGVWKRIACRDCGERRLSTRTGRH